MGKTVKDQAHIDHEARMAIGVRARQIYGDQLRAGINLKYKDAIEMAYQEHEKQQRVQQLTIQL